MNKREARIRRAESLRDYEACVAIQREIWGFADIADYASIPLMRVQNIYGGSVLVVEAPHGGIGAFAYALLCRRPGGGDFWWSHMTAVSRSLQGSGIGFELKLAQRNEALRQGIPEIAWTFDPLQARNAHFNLRKLGVVAGHYEDNFYGVSSSGLHNGLPTDRLRVSWVLSSERVEDRVSHAGPVIIRDFDGIVRALECRDGTPGKPNLLHRETPLMLEAPPVYPEGQQAAGGSARDWQDALRTTFRHYFGLGYSATDFIFVGTTPPRAFYVLERA